MYLLYSHYCNKLYIYSPVCDMGWSLSTLLFISNVSADAMDFVHSAALPVSDKRKEAAQVSLVISCAFQWESANGWSKSKSNYCVRNSHSLCLILGREVCDLVLMKRKWPEKKKTKWTYFSHRRRLSWLCPPWPDLSPPWTPHHSERRSTRYHRIYRCLVTPRGERMSQHIKKLYKAEWHF